MNLPQFLNLLDTYGTNLQAWPDAAAAQQFLDRTPAARQALNAAKNIEQSLRNDVTVAPAELSARILQSLPAQDMAARSLWQELLLVLPKQQRWLRVASALAPLLFGFLFGYSSDFVSQEADDGYYLWVYADNLEATLGEFSSNSDFAEEEDPQ